MKLHIPTEQYGFIEVEVETIEEAVDMNLAVKNAFKPKVGLSQKEFNKALDRYLTDGTGDTETYLAMNNDQKRVIQEVKKAYKRIGALEDKD